MSVLIKGIKMPTSGELLVIIAPNGEVKFKKSVASVWDKTTAVYIPPHGRLIDRDKLRIRDAEKQAYEAYLREKDEDFIEEPIIEYNRGYLEGLTHASGLVRFAPTIIPASKEEV